MPQSNPSYPIFQISSLEASYQTHFLNTHQIKYKDPMQETFQQALKYIKELPPTRNPHLIQPKQEIPKSPTKTNSSFMVYSNRPLMDKTKPKLQAASKS